jgi:hypothetical protein
MITVHFVIEYSWDVEAEMNCLHHIAADGQEPKIYHFLLIALLEGGGQGLTIGGKWKRGRMTH